MTTEQPDNSGTSIEVMTPENQANDIKWRIAKVADQVGEFYNGYLAVRKSIKSQLEEIVHLGINTYKMQQIQLRDMIDETFAEKHVSLSYLRKLLPDVLKMTARTNKRYLEGAQQEEKDDELEDDGTSPIYKGSLTTSGSTTNGSTGTSTVTVPKDDYSDLVDAPPAKRITVSEDVVRHYKEEIKKLKLQLQTLQDQLGEIFTAKAIVDIRGNQIPILITVDPRKQEVKSVEADEATIRKIAQTQVRNGNK